VKLYEFFQHFRLCGGSKLLDGIWPQSSERFDMGPCGDSGDSLFELFHHHGNVSRNDSTAAKPKINPANDVCSPKYYTPFGSGISLDGLSDSPLPTKSCWNSQPSKSLDVIGNPLQSAAMTKKINTAKFSAVERPSDFSTRASCEQLEQHGTAMLLGLPFEQRKSDESIDRVSVGAQSRYLQHRDRLGCRAVCGSIPDYCAGKTAPTKLVTITGESRCIAVEQQEKQLLATQQMFMQELNRLPPDLRKQYVDYMIASHLGLLPAPCHTVPAIPGMYYNVAVGPSAVPVTQMFGPPPMIVPLVPTPLVTVQPVGPSSVTKSVTR